MKIGVILSGCGVYDGAEIHEATLTLLILDQQRLDYQCFAPNREQYHVINHLTGEPMDEKRNVLVEAARIARGDILDLAEAKGADCDAWVLPGGFGAAKNLCTFAQEGPACQVDPHVERVLKEAHAAGKPIGLACIAPAVGAKVFGGLTPTPKLTIGHDESTAEGLTKLGVEHLPCAVNEVICDPAHKLVSSPCYMEAKHIREVYLGLEKLITKVISMI
jgi:enhancing lycopene biosynthesis protein 2